MRHAAYRTLAALIISLAVIPAAVRADNPEFDKKCNEILQRLQSFYAVKSTQMGIHDYDHRFTDYSSGSVKDMVGDLKKFQKDIYKYRNAELGTHDDIDYKLIKSNLDMALLDLDKIDWHRRSPQLYVDEAVNGIYTLMTTDTALLRQRLYSIVSRMKAVPELFKTARENIRKAPEIYISTASESLLSGMDFYKEVAGTLMNRFPERADEILKVSTKAREAMSSFDAYLQALERTDPHDFAIGKQNFDYMLSHGYLLDIDSDSMLALGEQLLAEANGAYEEYLAYVEANQDGQDSIFVPASFSRQDILDYYKWELKQVQIFIDQHDLLTIPPSIAPLKIVQTPPFLQSMISSIAYEPAGPFDKHQRGIFYIRPVPEDLSQEQLEARYRYVVRRGFRGSIVHEAYPGHHLQMQISGSNPDPVRKWQQNLMLIEGWALYSEEMMYHAGLYGEEDPTQWLGVLRGIRFRAARIVADVKLHTGQFTPEECVAWMTGALDVTSDSGMEFLRKEVARYTLTPTVQMSYLMGKREIIRLRDAYERKMGEAFSLQDFHDRILTEGSIQPVLLWDILHLR